MLSLAFSDTFSGIWGAVVGWLENLIMVMIAVLPDSPFQKIQLPAFMNDFIGYINYVVPFGAMLTVTVAWMTAILLYYVIVVILRWIKVVS